MSDCLAVSRLVYKRERILTSIPTISAYQISVYLYSVNTFDQLLRDAVIQNGSPTRTLYKQLIKICKTEKSAYSSFISALVRIEREDLADEIQSAPVFETVETHLNFLGKQLLVKSKERIENFVDYIMENTFELIVMETPINNVKPQFDVSSLGYNHLHHKRDSSGCSTPSSGFINKVIDLALKDTATGNTPWTLTDFNVSSLHGKATLIEGPAGIGKSTLCGQLSCMFLKGQIPSKFQNVILISCRNLNCFGAQKITFEQLLRTYGYIVEYDFTSPNFSDQLLIFDGFEEFKRRVHILDEPSQVEPSFSTNHPPVDSPDSGREMSTDQWIRYLVCKSGVSIIVVSRPGSLRFLKDIPFKVRLRVFGFNDETIRSFFSMYNSSDKLHWLEQTKDYMSVYSQLYKPVNCAMYIRIFSDPNYNQIPSGSTELHKRIFLLLIDQSNYVHQSPDVTGITDPITMETLNPTLSAIIENRVAKDTDKNVLKLTRTFLESVITVCFKMVCPEKESSHDRSNSISPNPVLFKSQLDDDRLFEIAKRCGLFIHYDSSAFFEGEDILLPLHLTVVEFGAALYLVKKFYKHVGFAVKNAARNTVKLVSGKIGVALFGSADSQHVPEEVVLFAVGLLADAELKVPSSDRQFFAKYHSNSLGKHLDDLTIVRINREIPDDTIWFSKLKQRVDEFVDNQLFETLPPTTTNSSLSKSDSLLLKLDNLDDRMQPSVLYSIIRILQSKGSRWIPSHVEFLWIKHPWVYKSVLQINGYFQNITCLRFWGCKFKRSANSLRFISSCSNLRELYLQSCGLSTIPPDELKSLLMSLALNLSVLCLSSNQIVFQRQHLEVFSSSSVMSSHFSCLLSLRLYGNSLWPYEIVELLPSTLEDLSLAKTNFHQLNSDSTNGGSKSVDFNQLFPRLKSLNLSANKITASNSVLSNLPLNLESLDLQQNHLSLVLDSPNCSPSSTLTTHDETSLPVTVDLSFNYLSNLSTLNLADCKLGNSILNYNINFPFFPAKLVDLDLSGNSFHMNEKETSQLFEMLPKTLHKLDLSSNFLKFSSKIETLSQMDDLKSLDLSEIKNLFEHNIINLFKSLPPNLNELTLPKYCEKFNLDEIKPKHSNELVIKFD